MFRKMRREKQVLSKSECTRILECGEWGTLGLLGDDGYPYTVPLNYVFVNDKVYFHSAKSGHKIDALANGDKASFCVVDKSDLVPEEFATAYKSVIVFGRISVVDDPAEFEEALVALTERLAGGEPETSKRDEVAKCHMRQNVLVLSLAPEHVSGKQAKCLARNSS